MPIKPYETDPRTEDEKAADQAVLESIERLEALHELSRFNLKALAASSECGCFHCLRIYAPSEIREWARSDADDQALTCAVCPHCSVDAVLPGNALDLSRALLEAMHAHWFAVSREPQVDGCPGVDGPCCGGFDGFDSSPERVVSVRKDDEGCPGIDGPCCYIDGEDSSKPS